MRAQKKVFILFFVAVLTDWLFCQTPNWVFEYDGPISGDDRFTDLVYGPDDNIYLAGYSENADDDFLVVSLTNAGDTNWVYRRNGTASSFDRALAIACGADGNIYATGVTVDTGTAARDLIVVSLSGATGDTNWVYVYNSGANTYDEGHDIVYGTDGNLYIAGWIHNDYFSIMSLTSGGAFRWAYNYSYTASYDIAHSLVCDADNNVYAAGFSLGTSSDMLVVSVDSLGNYRWQYPLGGTAGIADSAYKIILGGDNNLYVAGCARNAGTNADFTVLSLTRNGSQRWVYTYNNAVSNDRDVACALAYGAGGILYAAGTSYSATTDYDFTLVSLTTAGALRWLRKDSTYYFNSWDWSDQYLSLVYGADGNIYGSGVSGSMGGDFTAISYDTTGSRRWLYKPNYGAYDEANSIVYGADGNVYAGGYHFVNGYPIDDYNAVVISIEPTPAGLNESPAALPPAAMRVKAAPCIFTDKIRLFFERELRSNVTVTINNALGAAVYQGTLRAQGGSLVIDDEGIGNLGSGVYFLGASAAGFTPARTKIIKH